MDSRSLVHQACSLLNIEAGWQNRVCNPFTYIRKRIEAIGVTVFVNGIVALTLDVKLSVDEFRGFNYDSWHLLFLSMELIRIMGGVC